jgi:hypothetical protein
MRQTGTSWALAACLLGSAAGCTPPPAAPEGLDASARYLMRNFYDTDAVFGAGVDGFLTWYEDGGGKELLGTVPTTETVERAFTIAPLQPEDVAALPLDAEIVLEPATAEGEPETRGPRDLSLAPGVIAVDEIPCAWTEVERMLLGDDPAALFGAYEAYERVYDSPQDVFFAASASGDFPALRTPVEPHEPGFDADAVAAAMLFTHNRPDPAPQPLVGNLPPFDLRIEARHGSFTLKDDAVGLSVALSYAPGAAWAPLGRNGIRQTYAIEMLAELTPSSTLRLLAVWSEPDILGVDPASPIALVTSVNQARASSVDLMRACEGISGG